MKTYIALIRKDEDNDYGVDFPDFPGCITAVTLAESTKANGLLFGELDQDNNGFLSLSEMSAVISKSFRLEPKQIDKILAPSFHSTDLNSDGQISLTEFQKLGMKRFNKMDINRDKVITTNEMPLERLMYP